MGRSKKRRNPKKDIAADSGAPTNPSDSDGTEKVAGGRGAMVRAVLVFGGLMGSYYILKECTDFTQGDLFQGYLNGIAKVAGGLLSIFGTDATVTENIIYQGQFRVQVAPGCDALEPSAAFVAAVLASPVAFRLKLPGVLVGTLTILLLNLVRVTSLFLIGIHFRSIFDMMHYDVWQAAFIVLAILFWAIWVQWATRSEAKVTHA